MSAAALVTSTVDYVNLSTSNSSAEAPSASAQSLAFLWLPYIIFTIVLLSLIALSFLRFHCERGQQNRRRQEELGDKQQHLDNMRLLSSADGPQPNGGPSGCVPEQYSLFMQYSQIVPEDDDDEMTSTRSRGTVNSRGKAGGVGGGRRPIVFTFNSNGSMVDVRCDEDERTNTFRLIPNADSAGGDDMSVVEIDLGNGDLDDLEPCSAPSSSTRHRDRRYDNRLLSNSTAVGPGREAGGPGAGRPRPASSSDYSGQNHLGPLSPSTTLNRHQQRQQHAVSASAPGSAEPQRSVGSGSRQHAVPPTPASSHHAQRHHHHHQHHQHASAASNRSTLFAPQHHRGRHSSDEEITCAAEALLLWQKRV